MSYLTWTVVLGTSLLGGVAGVLGSFAVLRRRALVGDLLSHAALPGLCLAFLLLGGRSFGWMLLGALATGVLSIAAMGLICRWSRTKEDAALGMALSTFFGVGIVLSSVIQNLPIGGSKAGLESYIYGQAAGMIRQDLYFIAAVSAAALAVVWLLYKEFKLLSFDPGFARAQGWPIGMLDLLLMGALALVTVAGLPAVGVVLMAAMLIIPGAAARFWTERLEPMLLLSALLGAAAGSLGTLVSAGVIGDWLGLAFLGAGDVENLPTGPVIVLCGTAIFLFSALFAPRRGAVARGLGALGMRLRMAEEHLLRTLYEEGESGADGVELATLLARRAWSRGRAEWLVRRAAARGLVERRGAVVRLTPAGVAEAQRLVRAHRLWELFLIHGADIAPDHVDRDADSIEHLLTPEIINLLEARLAASELRVAATVPQSPHPPAEKEGRRGVV